MIGNRPWAATLLAFVLLATSPWAWAQSPAPAAQAAGQPRPPEPAPDAGRTGKADGDADRSASPGGKAAPDNGDRKRAYHEHVIRVRQRPWDDRAVTDFADWLERQDKPRARLVRLQIQLSQLGYDDPRRERLAREEQELLREHQARWAGPLGPMAQKARVKFMVGLIDTVAIEGAQDDDVALLEKAPELRALTLSSPKLTAAGHGRLVCLPNLDALTIEGERPLPDGTVAHLERLPPWTAVRLSVPSLDADAARKADERRIAKLQTLDPADKHSAGARFLRAMTGSDGPYGRPLTRADLGQSGIDDAQMQLLACLPELESVYISESDVTSRGVALLAGLKNLKSLGLWRTKVESITALTGLTNLESLEVQPEFGTKMGDAGLEGLEHLTKLERLYLRDEAIADGTVKRLAPLTRLRSLDLTAPGLQSGDALAALSGLKELRSLSLHAGNVRDETLRHLAGLTLIDTLSVRVSGGTGAGFRHLAGLQKLRHLFVTGAGVTDEAAEQLRGLKSLRLVMAQGSAITEAGARRLAAGLRGVTIILDEAVVKSPREAYTFRRLRVGKGVSVLVPADSAGDQMASGGSLSVREDGWEKVGGWSGAAVGPAEIQMYVSDQAASARAAMAGRVNNNAHLNPKVLRTDVQALSGSKDAASCVYRNDHGEHLVCAARVAGGFVVLDCEATSARFSAFEATFLFVAKSVRISDDPKQHADETVEVRADALNPK